MKSFRFGLLVVIFAIVVSGIVRGSEPGEATANVFVSAPQLPATLKRVAVLPLVCEENDPNLTDGCEMLGPVLQAALIKTGRFEVVAASPDMLRRCTGSPSWTGNEILPAGFFDSLHQVYECDAVLFCKLTVFRPTPPLAVGWRLKLVDAQTGKIIWAADDIFDAGNLHVARSAQRFEEREQPRHSIFYDAYSFLAWCVNTPTRSALDDQWKILHSPQYFGKYSAETLLKTLPQR